jgi:hypothetical protein
MSEAKKIIDLIEVTENGIIQIREKTFLEAAGKEIVSFHRTTIAPGEDYSNQPEEVRKICLTVHTNEIVENYKNNIIRFSIANQDLIEN